MQTIPTITNKDIKNKSEKFLAALQTAKALQSDLEAFWQLIEDEMKNHSIQSIKGSWGSLSIAERKNWKATNLPPRFYKQTLDTARLNSMYKLGDKLPEGASFTTSQYLSKRIK